MPVNYANAAVPVAPTVAFPATIANGVTYDSGLIQSRGADISVWVEFNHALTMHIIQYADPAGAFVVQDTTVAVGANTPVNGLVNDGKLFAAYRITLANASGSLATKTGANILQ
jgi:hypothetical protein